MRKVVPLLLALVVVFLVVRSVKNGDTTVAPPATPTAHSPNNAPDPVPSGVTPTSTPAAKSAELPRPADAAVAGVMDEMMAAWNKYQSFYTDIETRMPQAVGHPGKTMGRGKYWLRKDSGGPLVHFELRNEMHIDQADGTMLVTGEELLTLIDGKHTYTFLNQPMHRSAKKLKINYQDVLHLGGPHLWRDLVSNNKLTLMPEEMRDNYATKVIKAEPNDGSRSTLNYFDKTSGLRVELVELDEQGQTSLTIKAKNVQLDPAMSSEQFTFVVPGGVTLEDQTQNP